MYRLGLVFNFLIFAAGPEEAAPRSSPPAAAVLSPSRRVERISVKQSMFMRTHKAATQGQAARLFKASSKKKRKRDSAEKTVPVEVDLETTPPVGTTAAADTVLVVPQAPAPRPLEKEIGSEQVAEGFLDSAGFREGGSDEAGASSPRFMETMSDLPSRSSKGKEKIFAVEPRLVSEDRPMTVEDSALRTPAVAYALATSLTSPMDQGLLNRLSSSELVDMGSHHLIGVQALLSAFHITIRLYCVLHFLFLFAGRPAFHRA